MRLLVVESDEVVRGLLEAVLTVHGHRVQGFADGAGAWEAFEREPAEMLVLDWEVPVVDAVEFCRRMRAHPAGTHSFLLVLTSPHGLCDLAALLDAGADDFLPKPVGLEDFVARLRIAERRMDVSAARRTAEAELQHARYFAGIAEISLVIQHEINNPLAALLANSALVASGALSEDETLESLRAIDAQAHRIADVVRRLGGLGDARATARLAARRLVDAGPITPLPKDA